MDIRIDPRRLHGAVTPPPSKSMAHRAVLALTLSEGEGIARISDKNSLFGIPFTVREPEQTAEEFFGQIGLEEPLA